MPKQIIRQSIIKVNGPFSYKFVIFWSYFGFSRNNLPHLWIKDLFAIIITTQLNNNPDRVDKQPSFEQVLYCGKTVSLLKSKQIYMGKYYTLQISDVNGHLWTTQKREKIYWKSTRLIRHRRNFRRQRFQFPESQQKVVWWI